MIKIKSHTHYADLLWILAKTDFKLRYHGSILGFLWVLLKPLSIFLVLNFVFRNIFGRGLEHYSVRLLTGIILWTYFSEATRVGMTTLLTKASLITKIATPKLVLLVASHLNSLWSFLINLGVLTVFYITDGVYPSGTALLSFLILALLTMMTVFSITLITAPLFVHFRDLDQIWEVLLTAGFYAAPIIYPLSIFPENRQWLLYFNPMTPIIQEAKSILVDGNPLSLQLITILAGGNILVLVASLLFFKQSSRRSAERI